MDPLNSHTFLDESVLEMPSASEIVLPDIRLATVAVSIIVFLAMGWIRAARRRHIDQGGIRIVERN